jgi:hypothetical protein
MPRKPRAVVKSRPARLILGVLAVAIFALSLQDDWDLEVTLSQPSHSFVAKVTKDSKENPGGDRLAPVAATSLDWAPSFAAYLISAADPRGFPVLYLLRSISVRAPPVV